MPPKNATGTPRRGRRSKAAVAESESVPTSDPTSETQEQGETTIEDSDDKVETQVEAVKETNENEGKNGQNGDDESAIKDQEEAHVEDQEVSEDMEQEGNDIEEEKEIEEENVIEEENDIEEEKDQNDEIEEIEEIEDIDENEKVDVTKAVEKEKDSNEIEIEKETNGNKTQAKPVSKENNDHNVSGVEIEMEDNFEPDFELEDNNGSKNDEVVMQADSEDEIEFLAEVEADRSELEKQKKRAIAEELVLCLICHEICNRGIIVKCCGAQACRACAMKKVLADKLCWVCPGPVTTQDLINDDDIRSTVQLIKSEEMIPDENIKRLKARHFRTEKARKALKEKTQNKEKKKKEFKKIAAPESEIEPLDEDPKSIEFKDAKKLFISVEVVFYGGEIAVTQIGYNTAGGESVLSPMVPKQDFLDSICSERGQKIADKIHTSNVKYGGNGFVVGADFETEEGDMKNCWNSRQTFKKFDNYLQKHAKEEKLIWVFFSNIEHYAFTKFIPKDFNHLVSKYCSGVMTYEDYTAKTGKVLKSVTVLAGMKNSGRVYSTDKLADCVAQVVGDIKDGKNCSIKSDFFKSAKIPSVPEWGIFVYSSKFLDKKKIQAKQAAISSAISKTGQYGTSVVRFVCWDFNFPVLVKLFNIAATTISIDYQGNFSNYICQGNSKVIRDNNSCYALISMKLKTAIDQEKPKIKSIKPGLDVIDDNTAVISFSENSGLEDTEEESKPVKCDLVVVGATNIDINGATSVLVNIVPCSDESSFGDNISFGPEDVFVLARPSKSFPPGLSILNSMFSIVKEGKNMTRILVSSKIAMSISSNEPLATAYLYTKKEFPILKKKILKESEFLERSIPQIMKPKELFTSKKTFAPKSGSGRVNVKDRLSLPDRRQMGANSGMNNMMEMMGNNMGMGMTDMMNPMMNFMNMQQQQELNMMMMNQNSMNSMMNQNKDMMGHSKRDIEPPSTDLSRKRGFPGGRNNEQFDVPSKKSYSGRSERRGYRMSPEREKPSFGSGRPMVDERAKQRRGEELEEEIAKYERELQLLKKMKELKEERSQLGSSSSRYGASSFSSSSKYNDYPRNDSYSRGGAMSPLSHGGSLSRGGDESRYGRRDRSPVGSKYDSSPKIGSYRDEPFGEKRYGSGDAFFSSSYTSSARGGSSGRDKPMDSWSSARQEGSSFGSSSRYDSGPSRSGGAAGFSSLGIKPAGPADSGFKYEPTKSSYSAFTSSGDTGSRFGSSSFAGSRSGGASSFGRGSYFGGSKSSFNNRR